MTDEGEFITTNNLVPGKVYRYCFSKYDFVVQVSDTPNSAWDKLLDLGQEFLCLSPVLQWNSGLDGIYPMVHLIGTNRPIVGWATFCDTDCFMELTPCTT